MPVDAGMTETEPGTPPERARRHPTTCRSHLMRRGIADRPSSVPVVVAIRRMTPEDWREVEAIYAEGIAARQATFETETPTWDEFDTGRLPAHRFVAVEGDQLIGWIAVSPTSGRSCYSGVVEHSVYVSAAARGRGVGTALLHALIESADEGEIWTIQTSVFPENEVSVKLHERAGFRAVGRRERIAELDGVWRDTILLERRRAS
jgi:phosphinothricin acetyltransferase